MNEESRNEQANQAHEQTCNCPVCTLMSAMCCGRQSRYKDFYMHLLNSKIEFFRAVRSLVDQRIASLEEQKSSRGESKRASKIEVE